MESAEYPRSRKVKQAPPVPIKTYKWEDIRRARRRGKYPFTYLFKGPYSEEDMEDEKKLNDEKNQKVRKIKKFARKNSAEKNPEEEDKLVMEVEKILTEEEEITEIKLKVLPDSDKKEKMEIDDGGRPETKEIIEESTKEYDSVPIISSETSEVIKTEIEKSFETESEDKISVDVISKAESRNTESEDTYTESNIEQYLDKEEISKSISDTSGIEGTTSMSDIELPVDSRVESDVAEKKRKRSDLSEMTKSNLSLYEKLKNTKFKPPTFKIPSFKKLGFSKKGSKRVKNDPKEQITIAKQEFDTQKRRKPEEPVYVYIPLNPTEEQLEQERLQKLQRESSRTGVQPEATNCNSILNDITNTNGAINNPISSKWKSTLSKTDKKSPPFKKKGSKLVKKTSPKSHKRSSPPVVKRSGDSPPVDYIHIPLHPTEKELALEAYNKAREDETIARLVAVKALKMSEKKEEDKPIPQELPVETPKESPKGAIKKKEPIGKKSKEPSSQLARDINKFTLKLKGIQKKSKKPLASKKPSLKTFQKTELKAAKKPSPPGKLRGSSPEYILKGPPSEVASESSETEEKAEFYNLAASSIKLDPDQEPTKMEFEEDVPQKIISKPIDTQPVKQFTTEPENVQEVPKNESVISKLNLFRHRKPSPVRKEEIKTSTKELSSTAHPVVQHEDVGVDYIYIPLKGTEISENVLKFEENARTTTEEIDSESISDKANKVSPSEEENMQTKPPKVRRRRASLIRELELKEQKEMEQKEMEQKEMKQKEMEQKNTSNIETEISANIQKSEEKTNVDEIIKSESFVTDQIKEIVPEIENVGTKPPKVRRRRASLHRELELQEQMEAVQDETQKAASVSIEKIKSTEETLKESIVQKEIDKKILETPKQLTKTDTKTEDNKESKKESMISKLNVFKQRKPSPVRKEESKPLENFENTAVVYPGIRHKDSIVEYIHIPLKSTKSNDFWKSEEESIIIDDKKQIMLDDDTEPTTNKESQVEKIETEESTVKSKTPDEAQQKIKTIDEKELKKESLMSKIFKQRKPSRSRKEEVKYEKKIEFKPEKKVKTFVPYPAVRHKDVVVEYIYIPLKGEEIELSDEPLEHQNKEANPESEAKLEETKPENITMEEKETVEEKKRKNKKGEEVSNFSIESPEEKEVNLSDKTIETIKHAEDLPKKADTTESTNTFIDEESKRASKETTLTAEISSIETKEDRFLLNENVETMEPVTSEDSEKIKTTEEADQPEKKVKDTNRIQALEAILRQKSIRRKPENISSPKKSVASKFRQSFKIKSDSQATNFKRKSIKKQSPVVDIKPVNTLSRMPPVRQRRAESIVEYTYIPLNPTDEELAAEKERQEQKKDQEDKLKSESKIDLDDTTKETEKDATKTGAIKKKAHEKEKKAKDSSSSLAEDIKKFALKLRELQKKSKKPTFKTFRKGSKIGKKLSPPVTKKPLGTTERKRSPLKSQKNVESTVDYIFIPLNSSPEELKKEMQQQKATVTNPTKMLSPKIVKKEECKVEENESKTLPITSSPFSTLKKTKEYGKNKIKEIKDAVQASNKKKSPKAKKIEISVVRKSETSIKLKQDCSKAACIPLKDPSSENKEEEQSKDSDSHFYEPIARPLSKEDEEDGLKTPIAALSSEEQPLKSILKTEESPKMHKKVLFKKAKTKSKEDKDYESIEIKIQEPRVEGQTAPRQKEDEKQPTTANEQPKKISLEDDKKKWSDTTDHEYEPISSPPDCKVAQLATEPADEVPPPVHVTQLPDLPTEKAEKAPPKSSASPLEQPATVAVQAESRLLRIPLDSELILANSETPEPDSGAERSSPDTQRMYLGSPTTTLSSRTDGVSTSQVDSAVPEHLPLKKESRKKKLEMMEDSGEPTPGPKLQEKFKAQAAKFKTKVKSIKKPTFTIPNPEFSPKFKRPKFRKPKFQRPKFDTSKFSMPSMPSIPSMPKMPDRPKLNFPSFNLPASMRRQRSEERQFSTTESSAESKKNIFDFRTYPRLFDKTRKKSATAAASVPSTEEPPAPEFATVPRAAARKKGPVGSRWVHRFTDIQFADEESSKRASTGYNDELSSKDRGDSMERRMEADLRYEEALREADDEMREYDRENLNISRHSPYNAEHIEYPDRWRHGSFRQQDTEDGIEEVDLSRRMEYENNRDERSSVASSGHRGVIEEIDSDQFFLREKGISQDNIQVGLYLSSEIRDAFRQPTNALSQMDNRGYDLDASDLSLTRPSRPKRKHLKKTKRIKKTPHASNEEITFDQDSVNTEPADLADYNTFLAIKPRRNKRPKILAKEESLDMSQASSLPIDDDVNLNIENLKSQEDLPAEVSRESLQGNIIGYVEKEEDVSEEYNKYLSDAALMYEIEIMKYIEQPEIVVSSNQKLEMDPKDVDKFLKDTGRIETPKPPTRRHKSLKSLTSEHDSIMGEFNKDRMMQDILEQEFNIYRVDHELATPVEGHPVAPRRIRSRSRTTEPDDDRTSRGAESFFTEEEECHEAVCQQDMRDAMGYAIVNKTQRSREPPLPSTPRRQRKFQSEHSSVDAKFFTVPRSLNDAPPPTRPTRNYSTLGPNRPPRKRSELDLRDDEEEKENIDISQYIEIEDEDHSRDLHSGEVINKMKGRPLPAPPRPPRKSRDQSKDILRDITQQSNIMSDDIDEKALGVSPASPTEAVEEITVSTQTDPLPDDFCCDEMVEEPTDRIVAPSRQKRSLSHRDSSLSRSLDRPKTPLERAESPHAMVIERRVHTPIEDETVTHASLLVRPVPEYPPDSFVSKRFGADIPEILPERLLTSSTLADLTTETDAELSLECEQEDLEQMLISESDGTLLPKSVKSHLDITEDPSMISTETEMPYTETELPYTETEKSTLQIEVPEQIPKTPEKPQRRKSQAQISTPAQATVQPQIIDRIIERQVPVCVTPGPDTEVEVLKAHRLKVSELDVERLNVSELQANKIMVSEIDGVSLQISELNSKSGNLVLNGLEIPSELIQKLLERLQPTSQPSSQQAQTSTEQVATQTSIEEPEPIDSKKFTEPPTTEQVTTQTSIEIPDEQMPRPTTEQIATQTSIEEPDSTTDAALTEPKPALSDLDPILGGFAELKRLQSLTFEFLEDGAVPEEFAELQALSASEYAMPMETARLPSPTIVVDPPEPIPEVTEEEEHDDENAAIRQIKDRIRFIEEEMSEFISDFTPDEVQEMKSEIDAIIDIASDQVSSEKDIVAPPAQRSIEIINENRVEIQAKIDEIIDIACVHISRNPNPPHEQIHFTEPFELLISHLPSEYIQTPDDMPDLTTDNMFLPHQQIFLIEDDDEDDYPITSEEQALIDMIKSQMTYDDSPHTHTHYSMFSEDSHTAEHIESPEVETEPTIATSQSPTTHETEPPDSGQKKTMLEPIKTESQPLESEPPYACPEQDRDSVVPKAFYELKSEQAKIIENIQREMAERRSPEHDSSSSPTTPPRPPLPEQERIVERPETHVHDLPYTFPYYSSEYAPSAPPSGFYLREASPHGSDDDVPVHHRRRRHHRHLSRSRSSSDEEDRHASHSRRHGARSPDPSIPQLSGQLARACSTSVGRVLRQVASNVSSYMETRECKQELQIALIILLILIAGLILLGFGSGKTVHLHHWEYFNPPKEL